MKKSYTTPAIRMHGSVESLTKQTTTGEQLDQPEQSGTPLVDVLLS